MSESQNESGDEDPGLKDALAPIHEGVLERGRVLSNFLNRVATSVPRELESTDGLKSLYYELRHAPSLGGATAREIRCAIAITTFSHHLESLAFQEEEGQPFSLVVSDDGSVEVVGNNQLVPKEFFMDAIVEAISCKAEGVSCKKESAEKLLGVLATLLRLEIISLPMFAATATDQSVSLAHNGK